MKSLVHIIILVSLAGSVANAQDFDRYIQILKDNYFHDPNNRVPFHQSSYYKDLISNDKFEYVRSIINLSEIDSLKLFDQDTLGTRTYQYIDSLLLLNDARRLSEIEDVYVKYVDQFCDRWRGIIGSDNFKTYDKYRLIRLTPIGSGERFILYGIYNILVSYKLHEFRNSPEAIIRVFETGKVDHLNYPILEYQFKCIPESYWGPPTTVINEVFLPYKAEMKDYLKEMILNMNFPPDDTKTLRPYKEYVYFTNNRELFNDIIDKDIENYALEHIDYWVENDAVSSLNSIVFESDNEAFKKQYIDSFLNVYLPSLDLLEAKNWIGYQHTMSSLLEEDYEIVSKKVIEFEKELRAKPEEHKWFLYSVLTFYPLTESFKSAFSEKTDNKNINENLERRLYNMAKRVEDDIEKYEYIPEEERVNRRAIKKIIRKYERAAN